MTQDTTAPAPAAPDYWAPPPGWTYPPGYPRAHPGVDPSHALEVLPAGVDTDDPGRWLAWRYTGVGGSDVSALLGMSRYSAAMEVYEEKTGLLPVVGDPDADESDDGSEAAYWGTRFEDEVRRRFTAVTGVHVVKPGSFRSVRWPWLVVNPDGIVQNPPGCWPAADGAGPVEGYEGKTTSQYLADRWAGGQVPDHAELQCQTVMAVLGLDGMHVACLIGGQRMVTRYVPRDDELIADLVEITREFWHDHVLPRIPPPPDGGMACEAYLTRRYNHAHAGTHALAEYEDAARIRAAYAQEKAAKTYVDGGREGKNLARALTADREELRDPDGVPVATWRHTGQLRTADLLADHPDETKPFLVKREVFDAEAFATAHPDLHTEYRSRVLLIKTPKTPTTKKENRDG